MSYSSIQSIALSSTYATFKETPMGYYNWTVPPNQKPPPSDPDDPPDPDAPAPPPNVSGLWKPIYGASGPKWCEPLTFSQSDKSSTFTPCNCNTADFSAVTEGYYDQIENSTINCSYCSNSLGSIDWYLYTENGFKSRPITANDCCDGICDTRLNKDDYLPKIPMLNQGLLSGFVDFKYMNEFPGCNNPGLGIERYIKFNGSGVSGILEKQGIILHNCELCIDWKIKECMSEIPYNELESQHQSKYLHEKSYRRSIVTSKTAGNFISLGSDLTPASLPSVEEFTAPYGFNNGTYNNLFYKGKRVGSYWKWKYDEGILMWQRYFEGKYESFISPGDFFYATMDGPEPLVIETEEEGGGEEEEEEEGGNSTGGGGGEAREMSGCPSGLKIIDNNGEVAHILPSGSSFFYISENIYPLFKDIFDRVVAVEGVSVKKAIDIAGTLATGPQYDNITLDLFATVPSDDPRNEFAQLSGLNNHMSTGMNYGSAFDFSYVKNLNDTIKNLRHKYGQYVWIPPRTTASIELIDYEGDFLELDYDMVLDTNKIKHSTNDNSQPLSYAGPIADKAFTYNFDLIVGNYGVVSCSPSISVYSPPEQCIVETGLLDDGETPYTRAKYSITGVGKLVNFIGGDAKGSMFLDRLPNEFYDKYSRAVLNSADITEYCAECDSKSSYYLAGIARTLCQQDNFCDYTLADYFRGGRNFQKISDGSLIMKRNYYAQAMNARIDAIAIHPNFGSAIESRMFGLDGKKSFFKIINDNKQALRTGSIRVKFTTNDVGIKVYDIRSTPLQSDTTTSYAIRFPVNYDNLCKCPSLLPDQLQGYMTPSFIENKSYTPNVSVGSYSPRLDQYGGYSQKYLDDNFPGKNLIAENFLESLTHRIDPEYPDGRTSQGKSISLPNYHTTKWRFSTNANTITISENADLYGTSYHVVEDESGFFEERINKNWKRFTTRVEINGNSYYDQQRANFASPANIHLVNPFLEALTAGKQVLHPPTVTGGNHFFDNVWGLFGPRGDEMSSVTLTFKREEAKNSVYFDTSFMNDSGLMLDPVQFHIKSGISTTDIDNYSHINSSGLIPFDNLSGITESDTLSFVGEINNNLIRSLENIYNVDKSKKPKIYIYYNDKLYEYIDTKTHEFVYTVPSQKRTFTGPPVLYEYISNSKFSRGSPYLIPIYRKHQPYFFAKYNSITLDYLAKDIDEIFPVKKNVVVSNTPGRLILPGVRHYFCMKTDQDIISAPVPITKVEELSVNITSAISYRSLVDFQGQLFMYIGGEYANEDRNDIRNYLYMPTLESTRYFTNFCNLSFDLSSPNISSYLPDSYEAIDDHTVLLYTGAGHEVPATVRSRRILVQYYLDNLRTTRDKTKNFRLFTELQLDSYVSPYYKYVDSINSKRNCSFVFFEAAEYSNHRDPYMLDPYTMYGDLRTYDDNLFNQPIVLSEINIDDLPIPKTQYFNNFYKLILSDLQESVDFRFLLNGLEDNGDNEDSAIYITGIKNIQYNIPQKYAIDDLNLEEKYYRDSYGQYENYLGVLDVNIFDETFSGSKSPDAVYKVRSNRLWSNTVDNSPSDGRDYILNLNKNALLAPVSSSASSVNMYAPALPFRLKEVKRKNNYGANSNAQTQLAKPLDDLINYSLSNLNEVQKRDHPFIRYDVHSFSSICSGELNDRCHASREGSIDLITHMAFRSGVGGGEDQQSIPVSDLLGKKISLGLSYDSGPGINFSANNFYTTIERSYDGGDSADKCMSPANRLLPQFIYDQKADPAYWASISALSEDQKTDIVNKTDKYANEVLFRILYGEKQEYNRERLFHEEEALTYSRLVDVSYDTQAKDIYRDIPYNYDRSAEMTNFYLNHNITIYGTGGAGDTVTLKIGSNTVNLTFNGEVSTVNVDINGQAFNLYLDEGLSGEKTVYDYIAVPKTAEPPQYGVIEYVGDIDGRCDISYGWRSQRFYTGDPMAVPGCSQTSYGSALFDCPVGTNLGPEDNLGGGEEDQIEITNNISLASIAPEIIYRMSSGINYECEDGSIWNCAPVGSCSLYGYGTAGSYGGSNTCMEFAEYTFNGALIPYNFQSCRTKFVLDAAIGSNYQYSGGPPSGSFECPSGIYDITPACGGDGSRGYIYSLYFGCNASGMPLRRANTFRSYCDETDDNPNPTFLSYNPDAQGLPGARQPGYDKCTMETTYNCRGVMDAKVYRVSSIIAGNEYTQPVCPIALANISYNTNSINIKLANNEKTYCKDINPIQQCEVTSLRLPNDKYYFTESIESECDSDKHTPNLVLLDEGTQYFLTKDVTLTYGIGSYSAADINGAPPILWGKDAITQCDRGGGPGYAWVGVGLCGVPDEGPWIGPKGIEDHKGLAGSALGEFTSRISTLAGVKNTAGSDQVVNINAERARWAGGVNYQGWVLRGPIGEGSVGFSTITGSYPKRNKTEAGEFTLTTINAFVSVPYRIPLSVPAAISAEDGDGNSPSLCNSPYDYDISHPFPDWYGDIVGARKFDSVLNELSSARVFSENFAILNSTFHLDCNGLQSDYNDDILNDTIAIRPCALTDYACWIKQSWVETINRNWRTVE